MALVPASMESSFAELGMDGSVEALSPLLDAQRQLFHDQVDQLQRLVVTQCKLTGVNPLAQEMAAGALSIKIGKKPRDLLNPKAIKYMQSVFAIKDTFGKKETREISALCGITVTQVRDFFAGQRSRVRKLVRLARERVAKSDISKADCDQCSTIPEASPVIGNDAPQCVGDTRNILETTPVPQICENLPIIQCGQTIPTGSNEPKPAEVVPSLSLNEETIPDIDAVDKKFLGNIFSLMRKEDTFSGQIKLMEWILQICNSAVLLWFSTKGGIGILANWLSEAAIEEQTTVLCVILKVFCHLPLHKAPPGEMSAILQTVNKLRFYRTPDISNRARVLLSRWSKMIVRNQPMKIPSASISSNSAHKAMIRQQRISEILKDEFWQSKIGNPEELAFTDNAGSDRKLESKPVLKLIASASDESNRKQAQNITPIKVRQRRKVLLVEPLDKRAEGRTAQGGRAAPSNHSRPISADDIQKAKLRAIFMQGKYGKVDASSTETPAKRVEDGKELPSAQPSKILPSQSIVVREEEEEKKAEVIPDGCSITSACTKSQEVCLDEMLGRLKSSEFQWHAPPVMKIDVTWRVGEGESSKEMEVQIQRIRREKETLYASPSDIPPNPKEPWDSEMDFDDSLTPEIPMDQLPDADVADDSPDPPPVDDQPKPENPTTQAATLPSTAPDLELLAVLLKNPELVFALTSGQGKNLTADERVAVLDMIKQAGAVGETSRPKPNDPEPTSLPSPTPPSDVERVIAWRSTLPTTQFPHQVSIAPASFPTANPSPNGVPISTFPTQGQTLLAHQVLPQKHYANISQQSLNHASISSSHLAASSAPMAAPRATILHLDSYRRAPSPTQTTIAEASLHRRPNGLEYPPSSHRFAAVDATYDNSLYSDAYAMHHNRSTGREETLVRSQQSDSWSPDRNNSAGHEEFRRGYDRSYAEPRREQRYEWSRQRSSGHRDHYRTIGGGRWREREGDRRR
ncbi:hypothetical protein HPP92_024931 [Vanilla planifolia]|uniref:Homeobox domain-containing protein n=1 Tax=Vanilla planifolia TaxID=51239 RepID=A0A835PP14_VANPL|nr:hypothetical protein HPP92_024931 [Vanilla planifolia]